MTLPVPEKLLSILQTIDRPVTFCTSGPLPAMSPGLEVTGLGPIPLPLGKRHADALKKRARQAPYGKGIQTVVDTSVRNVWEIDAGKIAFGNSLWTTVVEAAVRAAQTQLGLKKSQALTPHLYKLLLYEAGSFFLPHRDGEKLDRMVATLVIALPAVHEGGELIVRHDGREVVVDFAAGSATQTQFAAFYADCEHEIRPVTSGYRLALVYNLTLEKAKRPVRAPSSRNQIDALAGELRTWSVAAPSGGEGTDTPKKLAVILDHQYTQNGLSLDALKGIDRAKADAVFAAAREAGCDASLALAVLWQNGEAEPKYGHSSGYGSSRWGRSRWYDDESSEEDASNYAMGEVFESDLNLEQFRDADGRALSYGTIGLEENEVVAEKPIENGKPDKEDFEGYTGNAGMTLDRWYHRAAVVLWPSARRFELLLSAGLNASVGGLARMVREWEAATPDKQESLRQSCVDFAKAIIAGWRTNVYSFGAYRKSEAETVDTPNVVFLRLLGTLADPALVADYLSTVVPRDASADTGPTLLNLCRQHGWPTFRKEFLQLMEMTSHQTLIRRAGLLAEVCLRDDADAGRLPLSAEMAGSLMQALEQWDATLPLPSGRDTTTDLQGALASLVQSFLILDDDTLLLRLVAFVRERPNVFPLDRVQIPVLLQLAPWLTANVRTPSEPLGHWLGTVCESLVNRTGEPPRKPTDWRRSSTTGCPCGDCAELSRFLEDPDLQVLRRPMILSRHDHLERIVRMNHLDATCTTDRRTRPPFPFVCTKTNASFDSALKTYRDTLKTREEIEQLVASLLSHSANPSANRAVRRRKT
jgi:predicted 2-oxoglutarate/Fe(II)-dependent dioxygenase YbiX